MSIIIGIDHGYYAIKTAHCSFPAGLTSYGEHEPYTRQGLLEFGGCFFVCGSGRQPIQRDKTVNDNYYLLTLAAIAKEIQQRGLPPECSVRIAAGLPLTSFGRDKPKFRDYLLRSNQPVNFKFEGVEYSITIEEVAVFPQGYAALMTETGLLQDEPSILYSKETVQNFVWNERAKQESGTLPHYQWGITRRAAVYLDQMAEYGKIQDEPIRPWEAEHNPLFQAISCNPSNSMKVIDIICRTRDAVMQLELSDKTKTNYIYCGFGAILNFFISRGEESYSPETLALFEKTVQENFVNGAMQKASFQTMRKAAHWIEEYLSTGQVSQQKLRKYNFACAPPEFENLLSQYQLYMDNENYLKEGSRQFYLSSVRTFFRTIATLGIYRYAEITLPDVTRCLAKISETFPLGIFNLTGSMRSFARFMAEKHPELPDISPALVFSAAKRRRVYVGYTHEDAQKIFSAINRSSTMGMRDYAMIMLAYTTGLRGCDIVNLKFDSIDWDACELRLVQEKTNIPVSLPLDTKTGNAIADYILHARPKCKSEYIFLRVLRPYTKIGSMWTVIAKYAHIALGKDRKMNGPHAFRRGMGRQLLEANIPAPLICDILGHSSSVSLRQYTASSLEKLKVCAGTISAIPIAQEALL